jgi:hypothetical protein
LSARRCCWCCRRFTIGGVRWHFGWSCSRPCRRCRRRHGSRRSSGCGRGCCCRGNCRRRSRPCRRCCRRYGRWNIRRRRCAQAAELGALSLLKHSALENASFLLRSTVERVILAKTRTRQCRRCSNWRLRRTRGCFGHVGADPPRNVSDATREACEIDHRVDVICARCHADELGEQAARRKRVVADTNGNHSRNVLVQYQLRRSRSGFKSRVGRTVRQYHEHARHVGAVGPHPVGHVEDVRVDAAKRGRRVRAR